MAEETEAPNLNTGKPWSPDEAAVLRQALDRGEPIDEVADFLCRTRAEIREQVKLAERAAARAAAGAARWSGAKPCYIRFGHAEARA